MIKTKCAICNKELSLKEFWKYKAPNREWKEHSRFEKPYYKCKKCCKDELKYLNQDFKQILKELDIPYIEEEWDKLVSIYDKNIENIISRYIAQMRLCSYYGFGYEDSEWINKLRFQQKIIKRRIK